MRRVLLRASVCAGLILATSCSWNRFTELKKDAPVVRLEPSDDYSGAFGVSLAVAQGEDRAEIYVAGKAYAKGGLVYALGVDEDPQPNPVDKSHCEVGIGRDRCTAAAQPVGLNVVSVGSDEHALCFISGYGAVDDDEGLWTRCEDNYQFSYPVPADVQEGLAAERTNSQGRNLQLATNRGDNQLLAAATSAQARAWVYEWLTRVPIDIVTPPQAGDDFGAAISVAKVDGGHLVLVSAPKDGEVWAFRVDGEVTNVGCLPGQAEFGRQLASGDVDGDGEEDFVVAGEDEVTVHSGAALAALTDSDGVGSCEDLAVDDVGLIATLTCENTSDTSGCGASLFGASLAVADTDGDGAGEVFVGAPHMFVREKSRAGAVLAYDSDGELLQAQIVSDANEKDLFGSSLAAVPQGEREIVAVGAEGAREVYLLYCAGKSDGSGSARCK